MRFRISTGKFGFGALCGTMMLLASCFLVAPTASAQSALQLKPDDHICYIGNTLADRMQHYPWLETYIHALHPDHKLTFRNLGFAADEVAQRPRSDNFGSPDQWLTKCEADVVFCFFGYNEALRGEAGLEKFEQDLDQMLEQMKAQQYNGESAPRLVVFSPIAHENLKSPNLPDGGENNAKLEIYTAAMEKICAAQNVTFVDLFKLTAQLYRQSEQPLTMNGVHLNDYGNQVLAQALVPQLFPGQAVPADDAIAKLHKAVEEKNYYWFSRYRVVDGYNVFGGRSKLEWFGQTNADVMKREMEIFDVMTANRDRRVWAVAAGGDLEVKDDNIPEELTVKRNKQGPLEDGGFPYLGPEEAISRMTIHEDLQVNVFASEEMFPRLVNPVQMAVDPDSRLWVACRESYPHWNPTRQRKDCIMILPDEDGDGVADEAKIFADELNSVTGFEFWGGGILVAAPPEIWFLKDTDGDDKADVKIRMLQGISSADTHHSANALLVGTDGWLHFSRGIFNVANFETPTQTYRSRVSGVHRFNPRTFEVDFHFPIGPNPHGDVVDRWGYQFANDGTSGTGSYINIGKGVGNKQWFTKRVRPVPANGIISSSHFPPEMNNNFLILNVIGFLGVLQHEVQYNGADITCTEIDPIVHSSDPNFRPSDFEIGGDGAMYICDWHNALIGHMQHNMRDPNRDHSHGRVYRITHQHRPLVKPAKMVGKPIAEVLENFFAYENGTRYRARLELSGRPTREVVDAVTKFSSQLDPSKSNADRDEAQALLECLWVHEEHRVPNFPLIEKTFQAQEPRVRAAAIRTLGHWAGKVEGWQALLLQAARDPEALVRAEAVKAAVGFDDSAAFEAVFEAGVRELDPEMKTVLKYAEKEMKIGSRLAGLLADGQPSAAARAYTLVNGSPADILKLKPAEDVYRTVLARTDATVAQLDQALQGLSKLTNQPPVQLLLETINAQTDAQSANLAGLGQLLAKQPMSSLKDYQQQVKTLATEGATSDLRQVGFANWISIAGPDDPFLAATQNKDRLKEFLLAVPQVDVKVRGQVYSKVEPLIFDLPSSMEEAPHQPGQQNGIQASYFTPHTKTADSETIDQREVLESRIVDKFQLMVPEGQTRDQFVNIFRSNLVISKAGNYQFFLASDDGSRLYIDGNVVVNNDGDHGMKEATGTVRLTEGQHSIRVNYFNSSGGNGLKVAWKGPGFKRQPIPVERLVVGSGENIHDIAVRALSTVPGNELAKFKALSSLVALGRNQASAITALSKIDPANWNASDVGTLLNNTVGYLSAMPARYRTSPPAMDAMNLAKALAGTLDDTDEQAVLDRLKNLDVRVIAIGTVPHRMIFDKEVLVVEAGGTVEFRFSNVDSMPHNFAIAQPGAMAEVGELAEATAKDEDAATRGYIPVSDKILLGSKLLQPGQEQAITFDVPEQPGVYPYVCTYPGHWRRMHGALYVVPSFESYQADPEGYLATLDLPIKDELLEQNSRGQQWTYDDLIEDVKMPMGRSFEVGKASFKAANCIACHQFGGEGVNFGPDLAKLEGDKKTAAHILRSIIEPSAKIDEKYASRQILLFSGEVITGTITEENDDQIKLIVDPLAKDKETVINKDDIDLIKVSDVSQMPEGMVDKLSREEIIDLMAYILSGADPKSKLFGHDHMHH